MSGPIDDPGGSGDVPGRPRPLETGGSARDEGPQLGEHRVLARRGRHVGVEFVHETGPAVGCLHAGVLATLDRGTGKWTAVPAQNRKAAHSEMGEIVVRFTGCLSLIVLCSTLPALADEDPGYLPGPWHYRAISCVDTTVVSVTPRLGNDGQTDFTAEDFKETGVAVTFNTSLGMQPLFRGQASVVHYQDTTGNNIMVAEHRGDRVQVCYLGGPAPTQYCNPDQDSRGRQYRVYDYRQRKQYWGGNSEHDCGGA